MPFPDAADSALPWKRGVLAALLAVIVGIGLSRFAYSALMPLLVEAGWVSSAEAGYLGAANLAGYLLGAVIGLAEPAQRQARVLLRASMLLAGMAFVFSALPVGFWWLAGWRVMAGVTGGTLMVLAAPAIMPLVPRHRQGLMSGVVFSGVGFGVVIAALLVPVLAGTGPAAAWIALGVLCLAATAVAWRAWPAVPAAPAGGRPASVAELLRVQPAVAVTALIYGLTAFGLVPHMVFLVDFIARGLGQGLASGGFYWALFGIGAIAGPLAAGWLADAMGARPALNLVLLLQIPLVALPALADSPWALSLSSCLVGGALSGLVTLTASRMRELAAGAHQRTAFWSIATVAFAVGQATGGYAFSLLFAASADNFAWLYLLGSATFGLALAISLVAAGRGAAMEEIGEEQ